MLTSVYEKVEKQAYDDYQFFSVHTLFYLLLSYFLSVRSCLGLNPLLLKRKPSCAFIHVSLPRIIVLICFCFLVCVRFIGLLKYKMFMSVEFESVVYCFALAFGPIVYDFVWCSCLFNICSIIGFGYKMGCLSVFLCLFGLW